MKADFSGYATKNGLRCSDGRTIMPDAFKHQDKMTVPLVWQHSHADPENVLGHAVLENRDDGVYAYGFFNDSPKGAHAKHLVQHGDITRLSIWANELIEKAGRVLHGAIREVSLVLSGANPGAIIENVTIRHSNGDDTVLDDEAVIHTGLEISHADGDNQDDNTDDKKDDTADNETVQDVIDSMSDKQKEVLHFLVGQAMDANNDTGDDTASHDNTSKDNLDKEGKQMTRNVFEKDKKDEKSTALSHSDVQGIVADAMKGGSMKAAVEAYALAHGINQIDTLFPEATALTSAPEFFTRRMEWVNTVLNGARKTPFSRVKTHWADLTYDDARAKGYVTGAVKEEEYFGMARRETNPQTVYKKQKLDRDDIIDITDFDVVAWMKGEMRVMLDEELARAALVGDGRQITDPDKIYEDRIRPIAKDDDMFAIKVFVNLSDAGSNINEFVDAVVAWRAQYRGTGTPTMYTSEAIIAQFLLLKDTLGRNIYTSLDQVAAMLRVKEIVPVDILDPAAGNPLAIIVNMADYVFGADKGGQVSLFDDFDIDYNQYKYLIETRCSGALVKLRSAIVVSQGTYVPPPAGTGHIIVPEPPNGRQSVPPVHGSLPNASGGATTEAEPEVGA